MDLKILLNGSDVTSKIEMSGCNLFDRLGGSKDNLKLQFPYECEVTFNKQDEMEITAGKYNTGKMYIIGCDGVNNNSSCLINAVSCRTVSKEKRSRILTNVTLHQIINDVAEKCRLSVELYDVANFTYKAVCQLNETDLQFLNRICLREGYSVKADNGKLVVFNDYSLENNYEPLKLEKSEGSEANFNRTENGCRSITVRCYDIENGRLISYTATDESIEGGSETIIESVSSIGEAERFAKGYLRSRNNMMLTGNIKIPFNDDISAGTVLDLTDYDDYNGRYIVYEVRHDIVNENTYLYFRKTLDY